MFHSNTKKSIKEELNKMTPEERELIAFAILQIKDALSDLDSRIQNLEYETGIGTSTIVSEIAYIKEYADKLYELNTVNEKEK